MKDTLQAIIAKVDQGGGPGTNQITGSQTGKTINKVGDNPNEDLTNDITSIINVVIGVLGLVCVIVMIIGGVNYMTSSGDAGKVKKAKDTILYGVIGLIICALAFAIVNWVIGGLLQQ